MVSSCRYSYDRLDNVLEEIGFGRFHFMAIIGLGWRAFVRGSFFSLTTIFEPYFKCSFNLTYSTASTYMSAYILSFAFSSLCTGWVANRYGIRKTIILFCSMSFATALLHVMSSSFVMLTVTITSCGFFQNAQFLIYPYLLEFFSKSERKYVAVMDIFYVAGFVSSVLVADLCIRYLYWQLSIVLCIVLPLIPTIIIVWHMPESPRYLLAKGDIIGALESLVQISATNTPNREKRELTRKYRKKIFKSIPSMLDAVSLEDDADKSGVTIANQIKETDEDSTFTDDESNDCSSLKDGSDLTTSKNNAWHCIKVLCAIRLFSEIARCTLTYASGQNYAAGTSGPDSGCIQECSTSIQMHQLISASLGSSAALLLSYNIIKHMKRRLALIILVTVLAIGILPFYFELSDWQLLVLFFLGSVVTESIFVVMFVYSSEVVPSSVRGLAVSLMSGAAITGTFISSLLATYALHVAPFYSLLFIHTCIFMCLGVVYQYAIETKDVSLA